MSSRWPLLPPRPDSIRHRLIFALDVETFADAERLVKLLAKDVGVFKVGKQLFLHSGPEVVRMIHRHGVDVFLDLKFHDIPHTVARAGIEAARLGVRFFDLHASGSFEMMERTHAEVTRVCRREGIRRPKILAVTVLTSLRKSDLRRVGVADEVEHQVVRPARSPPCRRWWRRWRAAFSWRGRSRGCGASRRRSGSSGRPWDGDGHCHAAGSCSAARSGCARTSRRAARSTSPPSTRTIQKPETGIARTPAPPVKSIVHPMSRSTTPSCTSIARRVTRPIMRRIGAYSMNQNAASRSKYAGTPRARSCGSTPFTKPSPA